MNLACYLSIATWIVVSLTSFYRLRIETALCVTVVGGTLFLPQATYLNLPAGLDLDKQSLPPLISLCGLALVRRTIAFGLHYPRSVIWLFAVNCMGAIGTFFSNTDIIIRGSVVDPAQTAYDTLSMVVGDACRVFLPFVIGFNATSAPRRAEAFATVIVKFGLLYSLLCIVEIRMSPQLHNWVYGFHSTASFAAHWRFGGYRPVVFLANGLALSLFMCSALIYSVTLWKARVGSGLVTTYLWVILLTIKSLGAIAFSFLAIGSLLLGARLAACVMGTLALACLSLPLLRASGSSPDQELIDIARSISAERAESFAGRIEQDEQLLARALERPFFGWGGYARNRIVSPETGEDRVVTDSVGLIILGRRGLVGYACFFALLCWPVLRAAAHVLGKHSPRSLPLLLGFSMVAAVNAADLLMNGLFYCLPLFFAGALHGHLLASGVLNTRSKRPGVGSGARPVSVTNCSRPGERA
jgi:hypothetical protein